jgi:hypothetical protein
MTSIEFLFNELWETPKDKLTWHTIFNKAKEMHKQEIVKAFDESQEYYYQYLINHAPKFDSETYYQETFIEKD